MKISEQRLKQIIKEEIEAVSEQDISNSPAENEELKEEAIAAIKNSTIDNDMKLKIIGLLSSGERE